uniref:Uncharacterized protein n=1 Tax=Arundo donax TaxID=35708 RepID=A0A0A9C5C6_ARUDO
MCCRGAAALLLRALMAEALGEGARGRPQEGARAASCTRRLQAPTVSGKVEMRREMADMVAASTVLYGCGQRHA